MNIWRIAGVAFVVGLAIFLVFLLLKIALIAGVTVLLVRVVGGRLLGGYFNRVGRENWPSAEIISIDNPTYRSSMNRSGFDRIIPIS